MDYLVVYSNKTGNTEKVAMTILNTLSGRSRDVQRVEESKGGVDAYSIELWNNHRTCSREAVELLSGLSGKKVALSGTCGMDGSQGYFNAVVDQVGAFISGDCGYLGTFMCAGEISPQIPEGYRQTQKVNDNPQVWMMIKAYGGGMLHPSNDGFRYAREFMEQIIGKE